MSAVGGWGAGGKPFGTNMWGPAFGGVNLCAVFLSGWGSGGGSCYREGGRLIGREALMVVNRSVVHGLAWSLRAW